MKKLLRHTLPFLLAIALLVYALKDISFVDIGHQFRQAQYGWIALVGLLTVLIYLVRGKRWQQPLLALGYFPTAFRATLATLAGVVAGLIIPGSGELTRCATLQRTDHVPFSQGVGSVVAERVIDLLMLGFVLLLTVLLELNRMQSYLAALPLKRPGIDGWWLIAGGFLFLCAVGVISWQIVRNSIIHQHPFAITLINSVNGLWKGFTALQQLPRPYLFVLLTVLSQFFSWLSTYWLLMALDTTRSLPPTAALTILAVSSLGGLAVPTQGGIGTYHFLVSRVLVLYGFTPSEGAVAATFLHAIGFGINLLLSSMSFLIIPFIVAQNRDQRPDSEPEIN